AHDEHAGHGDDALQRRSPIAPASALSVTSAHGIWSSAPAPGRSSLKCRRRTRGSPVYSSRVVRPAGSGSCNRPARSHPGMSSRALLIDGLGTLVSLAPPAPALRDELAVRFGIEVSEEAAGRALAAEIAYYRSHMGLGRDGESLAALRRRCA